MLDVYHAPTPNGQKVRVFLEETGLAHRVIPVSLRKGEQFAPAFLAVSPNNKIPALVDHAPADGAAPLVLFESGAILLYLAEKTGLFLPADMRGRAEVLKWLFWQMGGLGPMAGQAGHFRVHAPQPVPYAIDRYTREVARLYGVLDGRLRDAEFVAGAYSIADMAIYPWIVPHAGHGQVLDDHLGLKRWFHSVAARPAVARAYVGVEDAYAGPAALSEEERRHLFGQGATGSGP
jgi:GST-like protein